jgi:hypothetical protein
MISAAKRFEAQERRLTAMHEAGHLVVAWHLGIEQSTAEMWREGGSAFGEGIWHGRFDCHTDQRLPQAQRLKIVLAGVIAENVWQSVDDPCEIDLTTISTADWAWSGLGPGGDLSKSYALWHAVVIVTDWLRRGGLLWPHLIWEARRLIEDAREEL